jgi:hypothetical protein
VGEDTSTIEREIRDRRDNLDRNLEELEDKARELVDWRTHYREHTALFVGAAAGLGFLLGLKAVPRATRHRDRGTVHFSERDTSHDPWPVRHHASWASRSETLSRARRQLGDTWEQISDGLLRTAADKALELVGTVVPGFSDHLGRQPVTSGTGRGSR